MMIAWYWNVYSFWEKTFEVDKHNFQMAVFEGAEGWQPDIVNTAQQVASPSDDFIG